MSINSLTQPESIIPPTWTTLNVHSLKSRFVNTIQLLFDGIGQTPFTYFSQRSLDTSLNNAGLGIGPAGNVVTVRVVEIGRNVNIIIHFGNTDLISANGDGIAVTRVFTLGNLGDVGVVIQTTTNANGRYFFPLHWENNAGEVGLGSLEISITASTVILRKEDNSPWDAGDNIFPMNIVYVSTI